MNVTITSDGNVGGTRVVTEDGRDISHMVDRIDWRHRATDIPRATIGLVMVPVTGMGSAEFVGHNGKAIRRIEYVDGSEDVF